MDNKSKYKTLAEWRKAHQKDYMLAYRNKWLDQICEDMGWEPLMRHVPKNYWTRELCLEESIKHSNRSEWRKASSTSYRAAEKNGWLEECIAHMMTGHAFRAKVIWTKELCIEEAKKHEKRTFWLRKSSPSYKVAKENGWLDECCQHMPTPVVWTFDLCLEEGRKFKSPSEWNRKSKGSYDSARRNGWYEICTEHMVFLRRGKKRTEYTKDECIEEAKKHTTRNSWSKAASTNYNAANDNNWLDECCQHMSISVIWTKDLCLEEARKYENKSEWVKSSGGCVAAAKRNGWLDECMAHMVIIEIIQPTKEECLLSSKECKTRSEWYSKNPTHFNTAKRNGWMDECITHMEIRSRMASGHWDIKENVLIEARKFKTRIEWRKGSQRSYNASKKNGTLVEICEEMGWSHPSIRTSSSGITKEMCIADAKKYKTRWVWTQASRNLYHLAQRQGWLSECTAHMEYVIKPTSYYTKEVCISIAKGFNTIRDWEQMSGGGSQAIARRMGWLPECTAHMVVTKKPAGYWNVKENVLQELTNIRTNAQWKKEHYQSYITARKNNWLDEAISIIDANLLEMWDKNKCVDDVMNFSIKRKWNVDTNEGYVAAKLLGCLDECLELFDYKLNEKQRVKAAKKLERERINEAKEIEKQKVREEKQRLREEKQKLKEREKLEREKVNAEKGIVGKKPSGILKWTKEKTLQRGMDFTSKSQWRRYCRGSFNSADRNGWMSECTKHMSSVIAHNNKNSDKLGKVLDDRFKDLIHKSKLGREPLTESESDILNAIDILINVK